ncbi:tetratricopeptide repeat protein, partial [Candidatus Neomarinimicrobiota bacterium]
YLNIASVHYLLGDYSSAIGSLDQAIEQNANTEIQLINYWIRSIIHTADRNMEQLSNVANEAESFMQEKPSHPLFKYIPMLMNLNKQLLQSNLDSALSIYEELNEIEYFAARYYPALALLYLQENNFKGALEFVNKMRNVGIASDVWGYVYPRSFYIEGRMFEKQGYVEQAILSFERLLNIWQEGDEAIPERQYAINRLQELQRVTN